MSLLPRTPDFPPGGPDPHGLVDPRLSREVWSARWAAQAARWRAVELAEELFGEGVEARLRGTPGREGLQGFLHLDVPWHSMEEHREREARFLAAAGADPILQAVPLLFVFGIGTGAGLWSEGSTP